jgi:hypothetical protein
MVNFKNPFILENTSARFVPSWVYLEDFSFVRLRRRWNVSPRSIAFAPLLSFHYPYLSSIDPPFPNLFPHSNALVSMASIHRSCGGLFSPTRDTLRQRQRSLIISCNPFYQEITWGFFNPVENAGFQNDNIKIAPEVGQHAVCSALPGIPTTNIA